MDLALEARIPIAPGSNKFVPLIHRVDYDVSIRLVSRYRRAWETVVQRLYLTKVEDNPSFVAIEVRALVVASFVAIEVSTLVVASLPFIFVKMQAKL